MLAYFWAHDCGGLRAKEMLGHSSTTVAAWSARFRNLKIWLAAKGGANTDHVLGYVKEFQWRHNIGSADPFVILCEHF